MHVRSQKNRKSHHEHMLEKGRYWMQAACQRLEAGEQMSFDHKTFFQYVLMDTLIKSHSIAKKMVLEFKVSIHLFQFSIQMVSVSLKL